MSTITMQDAVGYFSQYKEKYNEECTLSLDVFEEIMSEAADDDALIASMHDAQHSSDAADDTENNDRSDVAPIDQSPGSAYSYAVKMDKGLENDLETFAEAALQNKRGGAVIMLDLYRVYGAETIQNEWPKPGSYKPGQGHTETEAGSNEPWDKEDTSITKADGTNGKGTRSFYQDLVDMSPRGKMLLDAKKEAQKDVGDVKSSKSKLSGIDVKRNAFKSAIVRAVNLAQKMAFCNAKTGLACEVVMDTDDQGNACVASGAKLIFIKSKTDQTKFDVLTIGQFLALKVSENATYQQIVGTTQRAPRSAAGATQDIEVNIDSIPAFDTVTAALATFVDKIEEKLAAKDTKPYNALLTHLNSAGTDDLLLSMNKIMNFYEGLLFKPGISKRLGSLIADGEKSAKAA